MTTIIIGAGASGLACAIKIKMNNKDEKVTLLEHLDKIGKKLLATGNGRCNLSNENASHSKEVVDFFSSIGLLTHSDSEKRIYPKSDRAETVAQILIDKLKELDIEVVTECQIKSIDDDFTVTSSKGIFKADSLVIATGGRAQKNLGSDGSGYKYLESFSHTITPLSPSLVQLTSHSKYPRILKGQRTKANVKIEFDNEEVKEEYGEILFTDYGLSGIVIMNLSDVVSMNFSKTEPKKCVAVIDLAPDMSENELLTHIEKFGSLGGILGFKIASIIEKQANGDAPLQAKIAKCWRIIITGTKGFDFAQVTNGGAELSEFDGFKSKKKDSLYACGEVLDKCYKCGGYNLNFAFYSGITVADEITRKN